MYYWFSNIIFFFFFFVHISYTSIFVNIRCIKDIREKGKRADPHGTAVHGRCRPKIEVEKFPLVSTICLQLDVNNLLHQATFISNGTTILTLLLLHLLSPRISINRIPKTCRCCALRLRRLVLRSWK